MKLRHVISVWVCVFLFTSCETWEPNIPEGDNSLREQIEGTWAIKAYILSTGKQEHISGNHSLKFGPIHNDTCEILLKYVNLLESKCVLNGNNQIEILGGGWGGTDMYSLTDSGNEKKFLTAMNSVNSGFVRNDSLFLIIDSQKKLRYKAICFTR